MCNFYQHRMDGVSPANDRRYAPDQKLDVNDIDQPGLALVRNTHTCKGTSSMYQISCHQKVTVYTVTLTS